MKQFFNDGFESLAKIDKKSYRHLLNLSSNESQHLEYHALFAEFIKDYDPAMVTKYPVFRAAHNEACAYHSVEQNQLMLTPGSDFAINLVMNAIGKNTQSLVTHHPNYNGYQHYASLQNMPIRLEVNITESIVANLSHHLGQVNIALTLGWIIGPPMGAFLAQNPLIHSLELPFFFAAVLVLAALIFCYQSFNEPIQHTISEKTKESAKKFQNFSSKIIMAVFASFLIFLGVDSFYVFIPVFLTLSLNASPTMLACTSVTVGVSNVLSNYFLLPRMHYWLSTKNAIIFCASCLAILLILLSVYGSSYYSLVLLPMFGATIALISPSIFTYISLSLSDKKQGALMGVLSGQRTLGAALISLFFALLINLKVTLPFIIGCIFLIFGAFILYRIKLTPNERE